MKYGNNYDSEFFQRLNNTSTSSADIVLEVFAKYYKGEIHSAVDIGCGTGAWLSACRKRFDKNMHVKGYDGEYVSKEQLVINESEFTACDLSNNIEIEGRYDIAISLEVAEHIEEKALGGGEGFVKRLVNASDLVLFSAAVPYQGGTDHVNEQYLSYWVDLFRKYNYELYDVIRPDIWNNELVSVWYRQNAVVFVKSGSDSEGNLRNNPNHIIDVIHPEIYCNRALELNEKLGWVYRRIRKFQECFSHSQKKG